MGVSIGCALRRVFQGRSGCARKEALFVTLIKSRSAHRSQNGCFARMMMLLEEYRDECTHCFPRANLLAAPCSRRESETVTSENTGEIQTFGPNTRILSLRRTLLSYHCSEHTYHIIAPNAPILSWPRTHLSYIGSEHTPILSRLRTQNYLGAELRKILAPNAELSWLRTQNYLGSGRRKILAPNTELP